MRRFAMFVLLGAAVLLAGCVQMHSETVIEKDGSGHATFKLSLSQAVTESLDELEALDSDQGMGGEMPSLEDFDRDELEKVARQNDVKITKFEKGIVDGRQTVDIGLDFASVAGLSRTLDVLGGDDEEPRVWTILQRDDGNYVLTSIPDEEPRPWEEEDEDEAEATAEPADPEKAQEDAQKAMAIMGKLMGSMQELDVSMKITVPGEVLDSNAPEVEGNTSIWAVNAANMMQAQEMDMEPEIVFSSKGVKIDAPKIGG